MSASGTPRRVITMSSSSASRRYLPEIILHYRERLSKIASSTSPSTFTSSSVSLAGARGAPVLAWRGPAVDNRARFRRGLGCSRGRQLCVGNETIPAGIRNVLESHGRGGASAASGNGRILGVSLEAESLFPLDMRQLRAPCNYLNKNNRNDFFRLRPLANYVNSGA
jgi:hypothetical protein